MKRLVIITLALITFSTTEMYAQSWLDALKGIATSAIDKVTGGKLTEKAIIGTWNYSQPGVKLSSDDTLSDLTAAAVTSTIQTKIAPYYEKVGIKNGMCKFVINDDGTFASTFGARTYSGTYTFDASTNKLSLKYGSGEMGLVDLGTVPAYAYINGDNLQIVFAMDKLLTVITTLGSNIDSLSTITTLLQKYNGLKIGFEFSK
ncbi:MAG: DUF4923 family protein [Alistipes sp.]|nr:DUF4923 family protein [Alistipes sp.]